MTLNEETPTDLFAGLSREKYDITFINNHPNTKYSIYLFASLACIIKHKCEYNTEALTDSINSEF